MRPTLKKKYRLILTWAAAVTSLALVFSSGSTYGRVIDWTSTELIYTPTASVAYSSCCLREDGQLIQLSDWQADEDQRTVTISISRPAPEPSETVPPTETNPTEPTEESNPTEPPVTEPLVTEPPATEPPTTEPPTTEPPTTEPPVTEPPVTEPSAMEPPTETTEEPDPTETTEEPNSTETTEEPNPTETTETPDPTETTEEPDPTETTEGPDSTETTEEPDSTETTEEPDPTETTETPDPTETTEAPDPTETTEEPDPTETMEEPNPTETTEESNPTETTEEPDPTETTEESNPTETTEEPDPTETTEGPDPTETTEVADSTEPTEIPDSTKTTEETEPEVTWPQDEVTVSLDATAVEHLTYTSEIGEDYIRIQLERREDALGLENATILTIDVTWFNLKGTITVNMLPYGSKAVESIDQTENENQVVTGLIPVQVHDAMNSERPIACVKLNLETRSDFTLIFMHESSVLHKVRWSLDGSEYKMLYDTNELTLTWPYQEGWDGVVYLDFSSVLEPDARPTIVIEASGYSTQDFTPVQVVIPEASVQILKASNLPHTIMINPKWGTAKLQVVQIEKLTADAEGNLVYRQDVSLCASVTNDGIMLTPTTADIYPEPGSYRLITQWVWNEIAVEEQMIYFFVNTN